jgi:hypothetical protein
LVSRDNDWTLQVIVIDPIPRAFRAFYGEMIVFQRKALFFALTAQRRQLFFLQFQAVDARPQVNPDNQLPLWPIRVGNVAHHAQLTFNRLA